MNINNYIERFKFFILSFIFLLSATLVETNFFNQKFTERHADLFEKIVSVKQKDAKKLSNTILSIDSASFEDYIEYFQSNNRYLTNQMMSYYVFKDSSLVYWSNNTILLDKNDIEKFKNNKVLFYNHAWYLTNFEEKGNTIVLHLSFLKSEYPYENDFIKNKFHIDFGINREIEISTTQKDGYFHVFDDDGEFLLGLSKNHGRVDNVLQRYFAISLYFIGLICLLVSMHRFLLKIRKRYLRDIINFVFLAIIYFVRLWMFNNKIPYVCYTTDLFNPNYFAASEHVSSLGNLLYDVIVILYFVFQIQSRIRDWRPAIWWKNLIFITMVTGFSVVLFYLVANTGQSLVYDSVINFQFHKSSDTIFLSIISLTILGILLFSYFVLLFACYQTISKILNRRNIIYILSFITAISYWFVQELDEVYIYIFIFFQLFIHLSFIYKRRNGAIILTNSFKFGLLIIVSIFTQICFHISTEAKHKDIKSIYAVKLANERDPVAEMLLDNVKERMQQDSVLKEMMLNYAGKDVQINQYLQKTYFSGFLNKYHLESTICGSDGYFENSNQINNCEMYFDDMVKNFGVKLSKSNYFFIDNQDGMITYFDAINYALENGGVAKLYIELNSKRIPQELGYPELLLEGTKDFNELSQYSYAKYLDGRLVTYKGKYSYPLDLLEDSENEYEYYSNGKYKHVKYKLNNRNDIIVSHKKINMFQHLVSFSYIFMYFLVMLVLYEFASHRSVKNMFTKQSFTEKIRLSLFSVLFASVILCGISLVVLNIGQYNQEQKKNVKEKMQSILVELKTKIDNLDKMPEEKNNRIQAELIRLSNIYFTDINLYDNSGFLVASSRPEIFNYKLLGKKINPEAYYELKIKRLPEFVHKEKIGELSFASAYTAVINEKNKTLGYLNLPYFTKQVELTEQITNLIVAILNIFVILIMLSTVIAVFLSNKITYPLKMLRDKMKFVKVGDRNEKISWKTSDEIGDLIKNYNSMIDELESSAKKLAASEREGAWREMAKQIAHEIKNPLTPIKLNLQLLNRSWDSKDPEFEKRLRSISNTIIEQIDTLSETASSFSNFAKVTEGEPEKIELTALINNCALLFSQTENIQIESNFTNEELLIFADKDKIVRLFNNLLKNATQAIKKDEAGSIVIDKKLSDNKILISITDNGCGIPEQIKEKLFVPNFTTKSTGSGLGLAMCKKIAEQANGEIWFESTVGKGTTFFVELPLLKDSDS